MKSGYTRCIFREMLFTLISLSGHSSASILSGGYVHNSGIVYFGESGNGFYSTASLQRRMPRSGIFTWKEQDRFLVVQEDGYYIPTGRLLESEPGVIVEEMVYDSSKEPGNMFPEERPEVYTNTFTRFYTYDWKRSDDGVAISFEVIGKIGFPLEEVCVQVDDSVCLQYSTTNATPEECIRLSDSQPAFQVAEAPRVTLRRNESKSSGSHESPAPVERFDVSVSGVDPRQHKLWIHIMFGSRREQFICALVPKLVEQPMCFSTSSTNVENVGCLFLHSEPTTGKSQDKTDTCSGPFFHLE